MAQNYISKDRCHGIARGSNVKKQNEQLAALAPLQWCHGIARGSNKGPHEQPESSCLASMVPRDRPWIKPDGQIAALLLAMASMVPRDRPWIKPEMIQGVWINEVGASMVPRDRPWIKRLRHDALVEVLYQLQWCHGIARGSNYAVVLPEVTEEDDASMVPRDRPWIKLAAEGVV